MVKGQTKCSGAHKSERQAIRDWPVNERPREKLLNIGPEGLSDGELLAVLLRIGKAGQSAEDLARQLISMFNGISGIDRAHMEELLAVPGMGVAKTAQLKAAIEIGKRARRQTAQPKDFLALVAFNRVGGVKQRMYYSNLAEIRLPMVKTEIQQKFAIKRQEILNRISQANVMLIQRKNEIEKMILGTRSVEDI